MQVHCAAQCNTTCNTVHCTFLYEYVLYQRCPVGFREYTPQCCVVCSAGRCNVRCDAILYCTWWCIVQCNAMHSAIHCVYIFMNVFLITVFLFVFFKHALQFCTEHVQSNSICVFMHGFHVKDFIHFS